MRPIRAVRMSRGPGPQGAGVPQAAGTRSPGEPHVEHPAHTDRRPHQAPHRPHAVHREACLGAGFGLPACECDARSRVSDSRS